MARIRIALLLLTVACVAMAYPDACEREPDCECLVAVSKEDAECRGDLRGGFTLTLYGA